MERGVKCKPDIRHHNNTDPDKREEHKIKTLSRHETSH